MNLKYENLSLVGKIWSIAEILNAGKMHGNKKWIVSALDKFSTLYANEEVYRSNALQENTMSNLYEMVVEFKLKYVDGFVLDVLLEEDNSIISYVWKTRFIIDDIKSKIKRNKITKEDVELLDVILKNISKIYVQDLKQKQLGAFERRDLFKIREEIQDVHIALDKKINHKHIDLNLK